MSTLTLQGNRHLPLQYTVPWNGHFRYEVESEYPVSTLVLDPQNFFLWKAGQRYTYHGGLTNQQRHAQDLRLTAGLWYLVIINALPMPTALHYNVWLG